MTWTQRPASIPAPPQGTARTRSRGRAATVRLCRIALLAALGIALSALESLVVLPAPVPGLKLGIANTATLIAAFALGPVDAAAVLVVRVVLASLLTGQLAALPFSLAGGACAYLVIVAFARFGGAGSIRLASMAAGAAHNIGQVAVAAVLTATPEIAVYLPVLLVTGTAAGFLTGTLADAILKHLPKALLAR